MVVWNAEGDFEQVVDTLEPVTWSRCGSADPGESKLAWRFVEESAVPVELGGGVRRIDLTWQLPFEAGVDAPSPGDLIFDEQGGCSVIRSVTLLRGATRYACHARRTELPASKVERFDLQRPIWEDSPEGPILVGYETVQPALLAAVDEGSPIESPRVLTLTLLAPLAVEPGDRLLRRRGGLYTASSYAPPNVPGDPYEITATETP